MDLLRQNLSRVAAVVVVAWCVGAAPSRAQVFSPGPLSRAHAELEGMASCTKCHGEGQQHDNNRCLSCHQEIKSRMDARRGYHGKLTTRTCAECHTEHKGVDHKLIDWGGARASWDHNKAGWPLKGAHKQEDCKSCHQVRLLGDAAIETLVKKTNRDTYLGMPTKCASCHFDEHRKQEGTSCEKCHTEVAFEKAPLFKHNRDADYPLTGLHKSVSCKDCHAVQHDDETPADAFPAPKSMDYALYTDIPHTRCTDCHDDAHKGQFGQNCTSCHSTDGWKVIQKTAKDTGFHDKTDFPLKGGHIGVACRSCHGPFPGVRAVFNNLPHARCAECHADAHEGQIPKDRLECGTCHSVNGFVPVQYDVEQHKTARYPLEGAHQAVACNACHKVDGRLDSKVPVSIKKEMKARGRPLLFSEVKIAFADVKGRCNSCHSDVHKGQFAERQKKNGCETCHQASSFHDVRFDHDDTRFPLLGAHQKAACSACHQPAMVRGKPQGPVVYRPLPMTCRACHVDVHVGQFDSAAAPADCLRCHSNEAFAKTKFNHNDATFSSFPLTGAHAKVTCAACHPKVDVDAGVVVQKFKGVAVTCAGCHASEHKGTFGRFVP